MMVWIMDIAGRLLEGIWMAIWNYTTTPEEVLVWLQTHMEVGKMRRCHACVFRVHRRDVFGVMRAVEWEIDGRDSMEGFVIGDENSSKPSRRDVFLSRASIAGFC